MHLGRYSLIANLVMPMINCLGGEEGIRTLGGLRHACFPSKCTRPLCDLSVLANVVLRFASTFGVCSRPDDYTALCASRNSETVHGTSDSHALRNSEGKLPNRKRARIITKTKKKNNLLRPAPRPGPGPGPGPVSYQVPCDKNDQFYKLLRDLIIIGVRS